jgi:DNA-binding transcriptional ArsR family regulator
MTLKGDEQFNWDVLVPRVVHPLKVTIVEAMWWIGEPLSASDLTKVIDDEKFGLSHVSYHLIRLAEADAIEVVRQRRVRGSTEKFYFFDATRGGS